MQTVQLPVTKTRITHSKVQIAAQLNGHTVTAVIQAVPKAPRPRTDHPTYPVAADPVAADPVAAEPMEADPEAAVAVEEAEAEGDRG